MRERVHERGAHVPDKPSRMWRTNPQMLRVMMQGLRERALLKKLDEGPMNVEVTATRPPRMRRS